MSKEKIQIRLTDNEYRLMEVIWDTEPVLATKLVEICLEKYGWKKSTVYTMLRRMDTKGILSFADGEVVSGIKREQALKAEGEALLQKAFGDSLPDFFAAFLEGRHLTKEESDRIQKMIRDATE